MNGQLDVLTRIERFSNGLGMAMRAYVEESGCARALRSSTSGKTVCGTAMTMWIAVEPIAQRGCISRR